MCYKYALIKFSLHGNYLFCLSIKMILTVLPQGKTTLENKRHGIHLHLFATSLCIDTEIVLPEEKKAVTELRLLKS